MIDRHRQHPRNRSCERHGARFWGPHRAAGSGGQIETPVPRIPTYGRERRRHFSWNRGLEAKSEDGSDKHFNLHRKPAH